MFTELASYRTFLQKCACSSVPPIDHWMNLLIEHQSLNHYLADLQLINTHLACKRIQLKKDTIYENVGRKEIN